MEKITDSQFIRIVQEERKHHEGIDLRNEDCGNAICIGGHKLNFGSFD
jgi:hypothetical protein